MRHKSLHKLWTALLVQVAITLPVLAGGDFHASMGYFNLAAKTSTSQTTISNLGLYRFTYASSIGDKFSFQPGYSLYVLGSSNIDLGYGIDLSMAYYPLSLNRSLQPQHKDIKWSQIGEIRPLVVVSFYQRQFQSIQSSYAGAGLQVGADYQWKKSIALFGRFGISILQGPFDSNIREIVLLGGVSKSVY